MKKTLHFYPFASQSEGTKLFLSLLQFPPSEIIPVYKNYVRCVSIKLIYKSTYLVRQNLLEGKDHSLVYTPAFSRCCDSFGNQADKS